MKHSNGNIMIWGFFAAIGARQLIVVELIILRPYQQNVQMKPKRNLSKCGSCSTTAILHIQIYDRIAESEDVFFIRMVVKALILIYCTVTLVGSEASSARQLKNINNLKKLYVFPCQCAEFTKRFRKCFVDPLLLKYMPQITVKKFQQR